jgi:CheY-like chemotaxis protein
MDSISSSTAAPSILVVEDDAEAREAIVHTLTQAGYEAVPRPPERTHSISWPPPSSTACIAP